MVSLPMFEDDHSHEGGGGCGSCEANGGSESRCGNGLEKVYHTTAVRYGYLKHVGEFSHPEGMKFTCGAKVVIQTTRGIEMGDQVSLVCTGCDKHVSREQIKAYVDASGPESYLLDHGRILREATVDDLAEDTRLKEQTRDMRRFGQRSADDLGLPIKLVDCEYLLGGDRAVFYFMADGRVDFRELVKNLSLEYRTRIKMHQVGARDEARLLADFETCGREVCCKAFLKTLKPITMRMAKLQRATLDPSKVSGRCGRLKCCLRYEHETYEALDARLPKNAEKVRTSHGYGVVVNRQILTQLVQIDRIDGGGLLTVVNEDVLERDLAEFPVGAPRGAAEGGPESPVAGQRGGAPSGSRRPRERRPAPSERSETPRTRDPERAPESASAPPTSESEPPQTPEGTPGGPSATPQRRRRRRPRRFGRGGREDGGSPSRES